MKKLHLKKLTFAAGIFIGLGLMGCNGAGISPNTNALNTIPVTIDLSAFTAQAEVNQIYIEVSGPGMENQVETIQPPFSVTQATFQVSPGDERRFFVVAPFNRDNSSAFMGEATMSIPEALPEGSTSIDVPVTTNFYNRAYDLIGDITTRDPESYPDGGLNTDIDFIAIRRIPETSEDDICGQGEDVIRIDIGLGNTFVFDDAFGMQGIVEFDREAAEGGRTRTRIAEALTEAGQSLVNNYLSGTDFHTEFSIFQLRGPQGPTDNPLMPPGGLGGHFVSTQTIEGEERVVNESLDPNAFYDPDLNQVSLCYSTSAWRESDPELQGTFNLMMGTNTEGTLEWSDIVYRSGFIYYDLDLNTIPYKLIRT